MQGSKFKILSKYVLDYFRLVYPILIVIGSSVVWEFFLEGAVGRSDALVVSCLAYDLFFYGLYRRGREGYTSEQISLSKSWKFFFEILRKSIFVVYPLVSIYLFGGLSVLWVAMFLFFTLRCVQYVVVREVVFGRVWSRFR